jgi:4-hydroxybenzoate polyprenyltransferase
MRRFTTVGRTHTHWGSLAAQCRALAGDIKLSHTLFAMPWAILAAFLAAGGLPRWNLLLLIVACMVSARTVAMTMNRLLDARLDALNPRTKSRAIPAGRVTRPFAVAALALSSALFVLATAGFWMAAGNRWPLLLSVPVLLFISAYPLLKRFTRWCHYYLGAALALAPVCAWIAVRGDLTLAPLLMAGAVLLWTAGFDIIYACQDLESDRETGVFSVPARLGVMGALWVSRFTHLGAWLLMLSLWQMVPEFGALYLVAVLLALGLLLVEHTLVWGGDLRRLPMAFFTLNGILSLVVGVLGCLDVVA